MHFFTFVTVSFAVVLVASAVPVEDNLPHNDFFSQTNQCVPGQRFIDQCNVCFCAPDGNVAACTRKGCQMPEEPHIDGFTYTRGLACVPGTAFYDNNQSCTCGQSGQTAVCTLETNANGQKHEVVYAPNYKKGDKCPAKSFNDGCNECKCTDDLVPLMCTLKACINLGQ